MVKRLILLLSIILFLSFTLAEDFPSVTNGGTSSVSVTTLTGNLTTFLDLLDTPNTYVGDGGDCVKVNVGETALEFGVCGAVTESDPKAYNGTLAYNSSLANYYLNSNPSSFWNSTFALFNNTYADTLYYKISNPSGFFNTSYRYNCTAGQYVQNMTLNSTGIFGMCVTPTLIESDPLWTANYTNLNATWSSTYNATYDAYNSTGLIKDWNISTYLRNWNSTGLIQNWSLIIAGADEVDPQWTDNFTKYNATWSSITNTSYALVSEPLWTDNFTKYNTTWSSIINTSYRALTNISFTGGVNITQGNLNISAGNITMPQLYRVCLNAGCTRYMWDNGTGVVIQG